MYNYPFVNELAISSSHFLLRIQYQAKMIVDGIAPILEIDGSNVRYCRILGLSNKQRTFSEISRTDYMICS